MKRENQINDLFNKLGSYSPKPQERGDIIRSVMEATSNDENKKGFNLIIYYLFGWTDYLLVRRVLGSVSLIIIAVFIIQQVIIINRIDNLEYRMVESNTKQLLEHQQKNVIINSAIMTLGKENGVVDSIQVADKDLRSLIDSYTSLQKQYEDLQEAYIKKEKSKRKL